MGLYPVRPAQVADRSIRVDTGNDDVSLVAIGHYGGVATALETAGYKAAGDMQVGEYTLIANEPTGDFARNVTVTHAINTNVDTLGTIEVTGVDLLGVEYTETIIPVADSTVQGVWAFVEIISIVGVGWVIDGIGGNEDQISFGWGDVIGLPYVSGRDRVLMATRDGDDEAFSQEHSDVFIDMNTVEFTTPLVAADEIDIYFVV